VLAKLAKRVAPSVDDVGEVAFQAAAGLAGALAFADFPVEVGARSRVPARLHHRDRVERVVQLPVAAAVEAVALDATAGGGDGRGAGVSGECGLAVEAADAARLTEDLGGDNRANAADREQIRTCARLQQLADLAFELACVALERGQAGERLQGEPAADRVGALGAAGDSLSAADGAGGSERSGAGLVAGGGDAQQRVSAVAPAAGLDDQLLARVGEQLQLVVEQARVDARQALLIAERDPCDHERVSLIVLAAPTAAAAPVTGEHCRHVDVLLARVEQPPRERKSVATRVLDRDQPRLLEAREPLAQLLESDLGQP
jgi:hypothetical protein